MSIDLERRPLLAMLRHERDARRDNWFSFAILGVSPIIPGTIALGLALRSLPRPETARQGRWPPARRPSPINVWSS